MNNKPLPEFNKPKYKVYLDNEGVLVIEDGDNAEYKTVYETEWGWEVRYNDECAIEILWSPGQHGGARLFIILMAVDATGKILVDTITEKMWHVVDYVSHILNADPSTWYK